MKSRLFKEIQEARDAGFRIIEECHHQDHVAAIVVAIAFLGHVRIDFAKDHPFKPPTIWINGRNFHETFAFQSVRLNRRYADLFGGECLCCDLFFMGRNWSPGIRLVPILRAIQEMRDKKHHVLYESSVETILAKNNLPEHLPIMEFISGCHRIT